MTRPRGANTVAHRVPDPPVLVPVHGPLLEAVRAEFAVARDWPDGDVVAACVALALMGGRPRAGLVHGE